MVIWLSLEIFPHWRDAWWGFFYVHKWLFLFAVLVKFSCRFLKESRIPVGTVFANLNVRLSSDLQLLVTPEPHW